MTPSPSRDAPTDPVTSMTPPLSASKPNKDASIFALPSLAGPRPQGDEHRTLGRDVSAWEEYGLKPGPLLKARKRGNLSETSPHSPVLHSTLRVRGG